MAFGLALLFVAASAAWLAADERVPDFDTGRHLYTSFGYFDRLGDGDLGVLTDYNVYPPLVHLVGALGVWIGGVNDDSAILAQNVVFVPALALGCYAAANITHGPLAGVLAAVFALAVPMVTSQFHAFMVDAPETALAAVSVALLLASDRFEDRRMSILAGVAVGLGMLTKQTFAGVRGRVRGGRAFARRLAKLARLHALRGCRGRLRRSVVPAKPGPASGLVRTGSVPERTDELWSVENWTWYGWSALNLQILLPLLLFAAVGAGVALLRWLRERDPRDHTPELIAGGLVGFAGVNIGISFHDPRYTLPALVYLAVLGTGWIPSLPRAARAAAATLLVCVLLANNAGLSLGFGERAEDRLPPPPQYRRTVRASVHALQPRGLHRERSRGRRRDARASAKGPARRHRGRGVRRRLERETRLQPRRAHRAHADRRAVPDPELRRGLAQDEMFVRRLDRVGPADPRPCLTLDDGSGVYLVRGNAFRPLEDYDYCPPGR